jgi:spore coat protein A, manganese oxidase
LRLGPAVAVAGRFALGKENYVDHQLTDQTGPNFYQIGTDQGLLCQPVEVKRLSLAPGERADLIVDFSAHAGSEIVMKNDALPLMQFRVSSKTVEDTSALPESLRSIRQIEESEAVTARVLTLNEDVPIYPD